MKETRENSVHIGGKVYEKTAGADVVDIVGDCSHGL